MNYSEYTRQMEDIFEMYSAAQVPLDDLSEWAIDDLYKLLHLVDDVIVERANDALGEVREA